LLKKQGNNVAGVTFTHQLQKDATAASRASQVCQKYEIPHHTVNLEEEFKKTVLAEFRGDLLAGKTPNPCVFCNRFFKFANLIKLADQLGYERIATGHYARVVENNDNIQLKKAADTTKDQTYYLAMLTQKQLSRCLFPLGEYTKNEVRNIAKKEGLDFLLHQQESQDLCFVIQKNVTEFIKRDIQEQPGQIIDTQGNILGKHTSLWRYTLGQKRSLNLPVPIPYFVVEKDNNTNTLIVSANPHDPRLFSTKAFIEPVNYISDTKLPLACQAQIRYQSQLASVVVRKNKDGRIQVVFTEPQKALTPGQYIVFYQGDICLGGGKISA